MSTRQTIPGSVRRYLFLVRTASTNSRQGFIGPIPYILLLRWLIVFGIVARFQLHKNSYVPEKWIWVQLLIVLMVALAGVATYITLQPLSKQKKRAHRLTIALDVLVISGAYWMTGKTESDFFLFYYLPIIAASVYLGSNAVIVVFALVTAAFFCVIVLLVAADPDPAYTITNSILRVFLPREVFFVCVAMISSYLFQRERSQRRKLVRQEAEMKDLLKLKVDHESRMQTLLGLKDKQEEEMKTLLDLKDKADQIFDVEKLLELTIDNAVNIVEAEGGLVSLVDFETGQLKLIAHTPKDYLTDDIRALNRRIAERVVRLRQPYGLREAESDPILNEKIYDTTPSVLCVPIMAHNILQGTLLVSSTSKNKFGEDAERFLQALAGQAATAIQRARVLKALREVSNSTASTLELDRELNAILKEITEGLGFEYATISAVDDYLHTIQTIRGKNVPLGWVRRSKHSLDSTDIQADIVRTGKTEVIEARFDERFDKEIYQRFGHENLARVWAPLIAEGKVVGTIEAGCHKNRARQILTSESVQAIERLGLTRGAVIGRTRPHVLLELIAKRAMAIIRADSASIHVYQGDQLLLEAGAGKATKEFLHRYSPRRGGLGSQAIQSNTHKVIQDPEELAATRGELYDEGLRAISAFPLSSGSEVRGVLYVGFWQEHRFSEAELELEWVFARQAGIAIQNYLLLRDIAETAAGAWALSGFQSVIQSLASGPVLKKVLEDIAENVLYILDADVVILYQYFQKERRFIIPPIIKGEIADKDSMKKPIYKEDILWGIVDRGQSLFRSDVSLEPMLSGPRGQSPERQRFIVREQIKSSAVLVMKAEKTNEIVGLMFVNYRTTHKFDDEEEKTINALASSAAIAISMARPYDRATQNLRRRDQEMKALKVIDEAIVRSVASARVPNLEEVLELILDKALEIIKPSSVGYIMWFNKWRNIFEMKARRGVPESLGPQVQQIGEGIIGLAAKDRKSYLVHDVRTPEWADVYRDLIPGTRAELAVPLLDENELLGVLNVENPEVGAFSESDRDLLDILALHARIAMHNVDLYQRLDKQIKPMQALSLIATRIQYANHDLDTALRLLLTGITAGEGCGFSRAMLFLTNDDTLQGKMAIGAKTREEADHTWKKLDEKAKELRESEESMLNSLLDQTEEFSRRIRAGHQLESPLSLAVQKTSIPISALTEDSSIFIRGEEWEFGIVRSGQRDPFRDIINRIGEPDEGKCAFACVPLIGNIGLLVVDNRFLLSEREIGQGNKDILRTFAEVMAMSINNARLRDQLADEQRIAHWKELIQQVGHKIGDRIALIANVTGSMYSHFLEKEDREAKVDDFVNRLLSQTKQAQVFLKEFQQFDTQERLPLDRVDLVCLLREVINEVQVAIKCSIVPKLPSEELFIQADKRRLSYAFSELITNADQEMELSRSNPSRIIITADLEPSPDRERTVARIEFADTGPGICPKVREQVFNLFITTKTKGSGLGLPIVQDTIKRHKGTIELGDPINGTGARFIIRLPMSD